MRVSSRVPPWCNDPCASATGQRPVVGPKQSRSFSSWPCPHPAWFSFSPPPSSGAAIAGSATRPRPARRARGRCPPVNAAHAAFMAGTVFAGTTPGVTAHLFAVVKTPPVAHLALQGHQRQAAQSLGCDLIFNACQQFGFECRQLGLDRYDQLAQLGQHAQHPRIELGEFLPVAWPPPTVR